MAMQQSGLLANPNSAIFGFTAAPEKPGAFFDTKGHDFLSPGKVQSVVDGFSKGANSGGTDALGKNPNSYNVLKNTNNTLGNIFQADFGFPVTNAAAQTSAVSTVGLTGSSQTGSTVPSLLVPTTGGVVVQTPSSSLLSDLLNYNPVMWQNPTASNVLLGIMDSSNKVFGGNGIFNPSTFNGGPLYPYYAPQTAPFSGLNVTIPTANGGVINNFPQALLFPISSSTGSPLWNNTFVPSSTSVPYSTVQSNTSVPYSTSGNVTVQPYALMVGLFGILFARLQNNG